MAFEGAASWLLAIHAVLAAALVFACAWEVALAWQLFRNRGDPDRLRLWAQLVGVLFMLSFGVGSILYPTYRVRVRRDWLDLYAAWAVNLFDVKEDLVALGLPLAIVLFAFARFGPKVIEREGRQLYLFASVAVLVLVLVSALSALVVTRVRGV